MLNAPNSALLGEVKTSHSNRPIILAAPNSNPGMRLVGVPSIKRNDQFLQASARSMQPTVPNASYMGLDNHVLGQLDNDDLDEEEYEGFDIGF